MPSKSNANITIVSISSAFWYFSWSWIWSLIRLMPSENQLMNVRPNIIEWRWMTFVTRSRLIGKLFSDSVKTHDNSTSERIMDRPHRFHNFHWLTLPMVTPIKTCVSDVFLSNTSETLVTLFGSLRLDHVNFVIAMQWEHTENPFYAHNSLVCWDIAHPFCNRSVSCCRKAITSIYKTCDKFSSRDVVMFSDFRTNAHAFIRTDVTDVIVELFARFRHHVFNETIETERACVRNNGSSWVNFRVSIDHSSGAVRLPAGIVRVNGSRQLEWFFSRTLWPLFSAFQNHLSLAIAFRSSSSSWQHWQQQLILPLSMTETKVDSGRAAACDECHRALTKRLDLFIDTSFSTDFIGNLIFSASERSTINDERSSLDLLIQRKNSTHRKIWYWKFF